MKWKQVHVKLEDHVHVPIFSHGESLEFYDKCLTDYLAKLYSDPFPENQPLWQIHLVKYPTSNAAGNVIFKLHHALGDGYSLMGALLSCLQRVDDPSLPLTFPSRPSKSIKSKDVGTVCKVLRSVPRLLSRTINTVLDFGSSISVSCLVKDEKTPIRSGNVGVEFMPRDISIMTFPLDQIKQIKTKLNVTTNDVITGLILLGTRLYMEGESYGSRKARSTALVLLNTRYADGYNSISEMAKPGSKTPWGNYIAFLQISIPKLIVANSSNPLHFVKKAQIIKRARNSLAVYLAGRLIENLRKCRGPESLQPTVMNYLGKLRIGLVVEKDYTDQDKFKSSIETAHHMIFKAAMDLISPKNSKRK